MSVTKTSVRKSLFTRYFYTCAAVILATILLMGILMVSFTAGYFSDENQKSLMKFAQQAVIITDKSMEKYNYQKISSTTLEVGFGAIAEANNVTVFLTDTEGRIITCSEKENCRHLIYSVPSDVMEKVIAGEYKETGKMNGIYDEVCYTVGVPVVHGGKILGAVFVSSSASDILFYLYDIIDIIVICALIATVLSSVAIYFVTRNMTDPLQQMAKATRSFAAGDFTARVPVIGDDEISQLAASFNKMADSLTDMESVRSSFIANVSHELKTPMMTIGGFVDGILDGTVPPEKQKQYLRTVSEEIKRLSRMVKSMLTISKIEAGEMKMDISEFDINELVCRTVFTFEQKINEKKLDVLGLESEEIMVRADNDLIHQVIYNLIDNAIKFSNEGGYISFKYEFSGDRVFVTIRNTGAGIPQEELPRIFDRFYKSDKSRSMDKTGVGLGLYIVNTIINQHKGDLIARSVEGEYTEFTFSVEGVKKQIIPPQNSNIAST